MGASASSVGSAQAVSGSGPPNAPTRVGTAAERELRTAWARTLVGWLLAGRVQPSQGWIDQHTWLVEFRRQAKLAAEREAGVFDSIG